MFAMFINMVVLADRTVTEHFQVYDFTIMFDASLAPRMGVVEKNAVVTVHLNIL
jgi:hypothetical protein